MKNGELLRHYQTESEDIKNRKISEKHNRLNDERNEMQQVQTQLDLEKSNQLQNKLNNMNAQRVEYEKYVTEKTMTRQKSGDFRKKTSDVSGTFKIGGENREIKKKNYDEYNSNLVINPTKNNHNQNENKTPQIDTYNHNRYPSPIYSNNQVRNRGQGLI